MTSENNKEQETENNTLSTASSFLMKVFLFSIFFFALKLMVSAIYGFYQFLTEMPFV